MPETDRGDPLGHDLADGDVVLQEQRLGAAHDQVVDDHRDQVDARSVSCLSIGLGDRQLGANAVGRRRQQRLAVAAAQREEPGESADARRALRAGSPSSASGLNTFDGAVAGFDVHPGRCVGDAVLFGLIRHRQQGYRRCPRLGNRRSCALSSDRLTRSQPA